MKHIKAESHDCLRPSISFYTKTFSSRIDFIIVYRNSDTIVNNSKFTHKFQIQWLFLFNAGKLHNIFYAALFFLLKARSHYWAKPGISLKSVSENTLFLLKGVYSFTKAKLILEVPNVFKAIWLWMWAVELSCLRLSSVASATPRASKQDQICNTRSIKYISHTIESQGVFKCLS